MINSKRNGEKRNIRSKRRNRRKHPSTFQSGVNDDTTEDVYAKAITDYEEFKRISKNNLQDSTDDPQQLVVKGESENKSLENRALNNGGRSVITYK